MANLAIDILKSNEDLKVIIALPADEGNPAESVIGFTRQSFAINTGNEWNTPDQGAGQASLSSAINGVQGFLNTWFNTEAVQQRVQHPGQTIKSWTGSNRPVFELPLMFLRIRLTDDVEAEALKVYRGTFGTSVGGGLTSRFRAPLGYAPAFGRAEAKGTVTMRIGRWFSASNLIINTANFNFADVPTEGGKPLWAEGSVSLEPFRAITYQEFRNYFRLVGSSTSSAIAQGA